VRWAEFERDAPRLASRAQELVVGPGVCLVATIRRDGSPRVSPVEPLVLDGDLWLSMMWRSRKAEDLLADDRILLHNIVTTREGQPGEVKLRGRAVQVDDPERRSRYREAVTVLGWQPEEPWFHLFVLDLVDVTSISYAGAGDQHVARWPARAEFVRRATSPTSVGEAESIRDLLR
jgi:hypothetical protein